MPDNLKFTKPELPKELSDVVADLIVSLFRVPYGGTSSKVLTRETERALELYGKDYDVRIFERAYNTYKLVMAYTKYPQVKQ